MTSMQDMLSNFESYGFGDKGAEYEMIIDKDGDTWVNYWNIWKGKANLTGKELSIPVHLTIQFVDGKIVQEYAYYDTAGIGATIAEIQNAKITEKEEETN